MASSPISMDDVYVAGDIVQIDTIPFSGFAYSNGTQVQTFIPLSKPVRASNFDISFTTYYVYGDTGRVGPSSPTIAAKSIVENGLSVVIQSATACPNEKPCAVYINPKITFK